MDKESIKIFSTNEGLNLIKSPVKAKILKALNEEDLGFEEIVQITNRSKSTVSAHLKALTDMGIISYKTHPNDQRKKIFYIDSQYMGKLEQHERQELPEQEVDYIKEHIMGLQRDSQLTQLVFHTLRSLLIQEGVNIDPILRKTGQKIGETLFTQLENENDDIFFQNIVDFWKDQGLGLIQLVDDEKLTLISTDCWECEFLPRLKDPACHMDTGIIESLLSLHFKTKIKVKEVECYAQGYDHCKFTIDLL